MTDRQLAICGIILGAVALILAAPSFWRTVIPSAGPRDYVTYTIDLSGTNAPTRVYCYQSGAAASLTPWRRAWTYS